MANCNLYHDKRRRKKDGTYPIKIRVTNERKSKFFETVFSVSEIEFNKLIVGLRLDSSQKKTKAKLDDLLKKANDIIEDLEYFNFDVFTNRFRNTGDRNNLILLIREKSDLLFKEENFSNSRLYKQAANLLEKFNTSKYKSSSLLIKNFTPEFLKEFQKWALNECYILDKNKDKKANTYSVTTINMYLTRVKAIINSLIETGELHHTKNPFGRKKYIIPKSNSAKRPLEREEIMLFVNYESDKPQKIYARDMFIFSYLANGMNFTDIFKLKWSDIKGDSFYFVRQKTSKKQPDKKIRVYLNPKLQYFIDTYGSHKLGNDYIFNVVPWGASVSEQDKKMRSCIANVNINLKAIASEIGVTQEISTYFARHSFITRMHEFGASDYTIKEIVGHEDIKSTQNYIGAEKKERILELHSKLLDNK